MSKNDFSFNHRLVLPGDGIVVGLSGGPDSVYLLHALHAQASVQNLRLIAAHLDHGWRPESAADARWCAELAAQLALPFVSAHATDITLDRAPVGGSREELGRRLRRTFLENVRVAHNAQSIALAHHRDDQIETFFIRLLRGAGVSGLASIRPRHGVYIHPLLHLSKAEILATLTAAGITHLTDSTNTHDTYLRNRIRSQVIPALTTVDSRFAHNAERSIAHLAEVAAYLERKAQETLKLLQQHGTFDLSAFNILDPFMQKQVLLAWLCQAHVPFVPTEAFFIEILRFLLSPRGGVHQVHREWAIVKKAHWAKIVISPACDIIISE